MAGLLPAQIGHRIRSLRLAAGLSRAALADRLGVDISSVAGWENGKRLPRDHVRARLAALLGCALEELMASEPGEANSVSLVDVTVEYPALFVDLIRNTRRSLRAVRLTTPYASTHNVFTEARTLIAERLAAATLEVQRVEIFYSLERLQESLHNILRHDGKPYYVRAYCLGVSEVAPSLGGYVFDDAEFVVGGYWSGMPPPGSQALRLSGPAVTAFFRNYWREAWGRGTLLNPHGAHDLSQVQKVAQSLGLPARRWGRFVEEARELDIGDGAPPMI